MQKRYYLINGEEVVLKEEFNSRFIINRVYETTSYNGKFVYEKLGEDEIVNEIFSTPPVEKLSEEVKLLESVKVDLEKQVEELNSKLESLKTLEPTLLSKQKYVVNHMDFINCERFVYFERNKLYPNIVDKKDYGEMTDKLFLAIPLIGHGVGIVGNNDLKYFICFRDLPNLEHDDIDTSYSILFDPTDDEIKNIVTKRFVDTEYVINQLKRIDDKHLSEELLLKKRELLKIDKISQLERSIEYETTTMKQYKKNLVLYKEELEQLRK